MRSSASNLPTTGPPAKPLPPASSQPVAATPASSTPSTRPQQTTPPVVVTQPVQASKPKQLTKNKNDSNVNSQPSVEDLEYEFFSASKRGNASLMLGTTKLMRCGLRTTQRL